MGKSKEIFNSDKSYWLSSLALLFGLFLALGGVYLFIVNTLYSGAGAVEGNFGSVSYSTDVWFPFPMVTDGGTLGFGFGIVVGLIANAFQFFSLYPNAKQLASDYKLDRRWLSVAELLLRAYDIGSTFYYVTRGFSVYNGLDWITIIFLIAQHIVISVLLLSIGSEIFLSFGLYILVKNGRDGFLGLIEAVLSSFSIMNQAINRISTFSGSDRQEQRQDFRIRDDERDNDSKQNEPRQNEPKQNQSAQQNQKRDEKRKPGRPPKNIIEQFESLING